MKKQLFIAVILISILCVFPSVAEQMQSTKWGYALDLPEGFSLTSSQEGARYQFDHTMLPITLLIASYSSERYENSQLALENTYSALQLKGEMEAVEWRGGIHTIGVFSIASAAGEYSGWAASVLLPNNRGTTVFLAYAPVDQFGQCEQIIVSALDSIDIFPESAPEPGIFTSYAYPSEGDYAFTINIAGEKINTTIDKSDVSASDFVVNREYAILSYFSNTPLWKEAWQRFYRVIYNDSYKRLRKVSISMFNVLSAKVKGENPENFDKAFAQVLLTWVQNFEYLRIPLGTDFVPLPSVITGTGSDCDSRALLLSVIMKNMGYDTMLFVSREYGHAFFGIAIEGEGARLEVNGVNYLLGETTAPVEIGLVPQDMSESTKWIAIEGL